MTAIELAVSFAILGSLAAVAVPAFVRELRSSKLVEPVDGLKQIAEGATAYAKGHDVPHAYPASAPLTPAAPPRKDPAVDPPGAWDTPTWTALGFRAAPEDVAHSFAFGFDSTLAAPGSAGASSFVAHAHGDLDGDGTTSTFEVRGHDAPESGPTIDPGMFVDHEVE
jgi:type II secretory pathway pseudopilin PulG